MNGSRSSGSSLIQTIYNLNHWNMSSKAINSGIFFLERSFRAATHANKNVYWIALVFPACKRYTPHRESIFQNRVQNCKLKAPFFLLVYLLHLFCTAGGCLPGHSIGWKSCAINISNFFSSSMIVAVAVIFWFAAILFGFIHVARLVGRWLLHLTSTNTEERTAPSPNRHTNVKKVCRWNEFAVDVCCRK